MIKSEGGEATTILREYVEGYLDWVTDKCNEFQVGYVTTYSREWLLRFHKLLIEKGEFPAQKFMEPEDFANAFSGQIIISPICRKGSKRKLGSIIYLLTDKKMGKPDYTLPNSKYTMRTLGLKSFSP